MSIVIKKSDPLRTESNMRKIIIIGAFFLLTNSVFSQEKILFHEYEPTASSWNIIQWNIIDTINVKWVLKEIVDDEGRVKELIFLENGKVNFAGLCYLATHVTFEYKNRKIIEKLYRADEPLLATECEMHYMSIYHLDDENYIEKQEIFFAFDFSGMDSASIEIIRKYIPEYHVIIPGFVPITEDEYKLAPIQLQVDYYYHSYSKMNGIYPVSRNYILDESNYYYGDEPEKTSIINGIKKLKNY